MKVVLSQKILCVVILSLLFLAGLAAGYAGFGAPGIRQSEQIALLRVPDFPQVERISGVTVASSEAEGILEGHANSQENDDPANQTKANQAKAEEAKVLTPNIQAPTSGANNAPDQQDRGIKTSAINATSPPHATGISFPPLSSHNNTKKKAGKILPKPPIAILHPKKRKTIHDKPQKKRLCHWQTTHLL